MATLPIPFLFCIALLLPCSTRSTHPACEKRYCGTYEREQLPIEFPFYLRESINNENNRCGYPGFDVLCNSRNQALITLPYSGDFVVTGISIENQRVWINDPDECLPRRFLQSINLTDSPFKLDNFRQFQEVIFLNCSKLAAEVFFARQQHIVCLSNDEYSIIYTFDTPRPRDLLFYCHQIGSALVPIKDNPNFKKLSLVLDGLYSNIGLQWDTPLCKNCEVDQHCGFSDDNGLEVTCYDDYNYTVYTYGQGGSDRSNRVIKYLPIAWGVSVLLFIFCITISFILRGTVDGLQGETNIESNIIGPELRPMAMNEMIGIDRTIMIEQYPKIRVGEKGQLPMSIDNVCSICLSEYEPMETLRCMPQCDHYFHADCIDEWLMMNATCPLCRNLPQGSACVFPRHTTSQDSSSP